jgi:hypothetical protein
VLPAPTISTFIPFSADLKPSAPLRAAITDLSPLVYGWYERTADLAACVLRNAEHHRLTKELAGLRSGPFMTG